MNKKGFAAMPLEKRKEISSQGGKAAHAKGVAHEWTSEEAKIAGQKGGKTTSRDSAHMETIGKLGGEARIRNKRLAKENNPSLENDNG